MGRRSRMRHVHNGNRGHRGGEFSRSGTRDLRNMRTLLVRPEVRPRGSNGAANGGVELVTECGMTCCEQGLPWYFAGPARLAPSFGRTSRGTFQILRAFVNPRVARPPEASPEWRVRELRHAPQIRALFPPVWASLSGGAANPPPALTQCRGRGSLPQTTNPAKSRPSQRLPWDMPEFDQAGGKFLAELLNISGQHRWI